MIILNDKIYTEVINGKIYTPVSYRLEDHESGHIHHLLPGDHTDKSDQELIDLINENNFKNRYADKYAVESIDKLKEKLKEQSKKSDKLQEQLESTTQHVQMVSITLGQLAAKILVQSEDDDLVKALVEEQIIE